MKIDIHTPSLPADLLARLDCAPLHYTTPRDLYHCIWIGRDGERESYCGIFGDGANASYEWFIWRNGRLETSDSGYGMLEVALRDVLNKVIDW